jgi:predicted ATPase
LQITALFVFPRIFVGYNHGTLSLINWNNQMPELTSISIKGFKSIASIEDLRLRDINLLIGANGSGKSNFIEVFSFLNALREGRLQEYVGKAGGANRVLHFGTKLTRELRIHISFEENENEYEIELQLTSGDGLFPQNEVVSFWDKEQYPDRPYTVEIQSDNNEAAISASEPIPVAAYVRRRFDRWRIYHFHDTGSDSPMKNTADVNDNRYLRADGSNLPAFLYLLRERHKDSYNLITQTIRQVAPFFEDFQLEPQLLNPEMIRLEWLHVGTDAYFDASSLSDGTLRFIALATLFLQPKELRPSVILVDEPELGMHPYAITLLASLMKQASVETQVIVSTQSSLLLDHFEPEDVLVADRIDGGTQLTRLKSADLESWLEDYSLGQLWEKNQLGGRPKSE